MHRVLRTCLGGVFLLAAASLSTPAKAQNELRGFGGAYYRGANNPSAYSRSFGYGRQIPGRTGIPGNVRRRGRVPVPGDAFGRNVAGPFGRYGGYGDYYTRRWYNWGW